MFTGGGTGGHFYPIIAVAEEVRKLVKQNRLMEPELYFMSPTPYNAGILYDNGIKFVKAPAGKSRGYFSIMNAFDFFKTGFGIVVALWKVFNIYPDVIFGKGGYASFPVLVAAKILRIPVVLHESDSVPGRVNAWAGRFAQRIAVSYVDAGQHFAAEKVAHTGNPVRKELELRTTEGARDYFNIEHGSPVILVLGGSQGAKLINDAMIDALPMLLKTYTVIHQTGAANIKEAKNTAEVVLLGHPNKARYMPFDYFNTLSMRMAAGAADLIISRAGSTLFEIAAWGVPSIVIPISDSVNDHQEKNAYAYARAGACQVIEERNLTPHILTAEVSRILGSAEIRDGMAKAARAFYKPGAAQTIAHEILKIALKHEGQ